MKLGLASNIFLAFAISLIASKDAVAYMQVGFVKARLSCSSAPNGDGPWSTDMHGYINADGFALYRSYYSQRHKEIGYTVITARSYPGSGVTNGFLITGYGVRYGKDKWDLEFSMPKTRTLANALVQGIEGFENPLDSKWERKCTLKAGENDIVRFIPENIISGYRDQISELKEKLKLLSQDTSKLDAATAEVQKLEEQLVAERSKSLAWQQSIKDERANLESKLKDNEARAKSLEKELAAAKANTPEMYAQTSVELSKTKKSLQSSESKAAELERELQASQKLIDDLMVLVDEKSADSEKMSLRLADLADVNQKIATLESQLTKAQNTSDDLVRARDRVISGQASEIARLESSLEEFRSGQQSTVEKLRSEKLALEVALKNSESRLQKLGEMLGVSNGISSQKSDDLQAGASQEPPSWDRYDSTISIQQQQFCALTERFYEELKEARSTNNDIKVNLVFKNRQDDLDALVPQGKFNNWIFQVVRIEQVPDGSAAVVVKTQCNTLVGSGYLPTRRSFLGDENKSWRATIPYEDRRFRELAKLSSGQFVTGSGALLEIGAYKPGQPETFYASMPVGDHPIVSKLGLDGELFIADFSYIAALSD